MIITRSPIRLPFGGAGTDLASFYRDHEGFLIAAAIDKYVYITIHQTFVSHLILKYSKLEHVTNIEDIQHPIVREALKAMRITDLNIEITSMADIPAEHGLGSSGSFSTALLKAFHCLRKNLVHPGELAAEACEIEIDRLGQVIGKQDPYIAAYGGITCFRFLQDGRVEAFPLQISSETLCNLEDNLIIFFARSSRPTHTPDRGHHGMNLHQMKDLGLRTQRALEAGDLGKFAESMNEYWRDDASTNEKMQEWYELARHNGAIGGRLIDNRGGRFLMFYAEDKTKLRHALVRAGLREIRFRFDFEGTKVFAS
jgi:D-glycero-alpha-D-manno-heptose-7-phosphate kinase